MSFGPLTAWDTHIWIAKELLCGGVAASIGIVIGNPFDVIKVRLQTMPDTYSSPIKCFRDIVKYEGVSGFYKGLASPVFAQFFTGSLAFAANSLAMNFLEPNLKKGETGSFRNGLIAGSIGGFAQCVVLVPTDLVKCKMQVDQIFFHGHTTVPQYSSSIDCVKQLMAEGGIKGMYRGFVSTACREIPAFSVYFGSYTQLVDKLTPEGEQPGAQAILFSGGLAGALSWGIVYPADVIKSNIQLAPTVTLTEGQSNPNSIMNMTRSLYVKHGLPIFFRGLGTTVARAFPVNAAVFYFYELFRGHLGI